MTVFIFYKPWRIFSAVVHSGNLEEAKKLFEGHRRAIFVWPWKRANPENRNNKQTEIERFDWFIKRIQTRVAFGWLSERSVKKLHNYMPENFLEINRYFALTSYCKTIGQSNNASSILGFSLVRKRRVHALIFPPIHWLIKQVTNTYRNRFSRS